MKSVLFPLVAGAVALGGCETVANVAQGVADKARGTTSAAGDSKPSTAQQNPPEIASASPAHPCEANFTVSGSFLTGKQFRSHVPYSSVPPDAAYTRAYAHVVKRGWQIVQADKSMRMISANQQVSLSSGGKTVPLNILVQNDSARGSVVSFTFSIAGGLVTSEDAVRDGFCQVAKDIAA